MRTIKITKEIQRNLMRVMDKKGKLPKKKHRKQLADAIVVNREMADQMLDFLLSKEEEFYLSV